MQRHYDVVVVGGGIVGASAAYHLVRAGTRTLLVDRGDAGQATAAGAGILSPETSPHDSEDWFDLATRAVDYYPQLIQELRAAGAGETGYAPMAQLIVAVSPDEDAPLAAMEQRISRRRERTGRPAPGVVTPIDTAGAHALFPGLAALRHGLYNRKAARVDGRLVTAALRRAAIHHGLELRASDVSEVVIKGGAVSGVRAGGEILSTGAVVLATGAWTAQFAAQLGITLPIAPQRGQIIHLSLPGVDTSRYPIVTAFHGHYVMPWSDNRVVVGATRETAASEPHTTAAGVREVLDEALRVAPGLAGAEIAEIRVGLRPATPDYLPILGGVPRIRGVFLASGHGPTGLQLGPYSGKLVAQLAIGSPPEQTLEPFSLERFAAA